MKYKIVANISLKSAEGGKYHFVSIELPADGNQIFSFDKLFETICEQAKKKWEDFDHIVHLRVVKMEEEGPKLA